MFEALEELMRELEAAPDNRERQKLYKSLAPIVELHRDALARILEILRESGHEELIEKFVNDPMLESLLRGYDLIASDLQDRLNAALEKARPYLRNHGGDVELLELRDKVAHLRLTGSCHGCSSSLITLKKGIETILFENVPELRGIEVEGLTDSLSGGKKWLPLVHGYELHDGEWLKVQLFDDELLVCTVDGRPFVFLNRCPAGEAGLETAEFNHLFVVCGCHGHRFDLRSGACSDAPSFRLKTYPATIDNSVVMVGV